MGPGTVRVLLLFSTLATVLAVTQMYDETLWTKQLWVQRWKLDKTLFTTNPSDDNPTLISAFPAIRDAARNSLDGPDYRLVKSGKSDVFDAEALDDQTLLKPAAQAVRCTVCHTLVTRVWQLLVVDLLKGVLSTSTASHFIPKYLSDACDKEVVGLLQRTVIYRMEMESDAHSMTFFVLRKRKAGTTPTQSERAAVQLACKDVLASAKDELATLLEKQLAEFKKDLNSLLTSHGLTPLADIPSPGGLTDPDLQQQHAAAAARAMKEGGQAVAGEAVVQAGDGGAGWAGAAAEGQQAADGAAAGAGAGAAGEPAGEVVPAGAAGAAGAAGDAPGAAAGADAAVAGAPAADAAAAGAADVPAAAAAGAAPAADAAVAGAADVPAAGGAGAAEAAAADAAGGPAADAAARAAGAAAAGEVAGVAGVAVAGAAGVPGAGPALDGLVEKLLKGLAAQLKREGILLQQMDGADGQSSKTGTLQLHVEGDNDEYTDPEEEEEDVDCLDLHPMCDQWASDGECEANPNYMVGNNRGLKGHCRRSCGLCNVMAVMPEELLKAHPVLAKEVQTLSNNMMQILKSTGCGAAQACLTGTSGVASEGALIAAKAVIDQAATAMQPTGGFVLGRPSWGIPELRNTPESTELGQRQQAEAQAALAAAQTDDGGNPNTLLQRQVEAVLSSELAGKLVHLRTEFFTYEYLYKNHSRHFHEDPNVKGKMVEDWSLGKFERESVVVEASVAAGGGTAVLHRKDLLPSEDPRMDAQSWPYVKQVYSGGDLCVLGGGRRAVRRTEVRIACSPDGKRYFLVREPDFCSYIYVLYSPGLCEIPHFKPKPEPTPTLVD